eukprot:RCo006170
MPALRWLRIAMAVAVFLVLLRTAQIWGTISPRNRNLPVPARVTFSGSFPTTNRSAAANPLVPGSEAVPGRPFIPTGAVSPPSAAAASGRPHDRLRYAFVTVLGNRKYADGAMVLAYSP